MENYQLSAKSKERLDLIAELTSIPSPTGYTYKIIDHIAKKLDALEVAYTISPKGGLMVTLKGENEEQERYLTAHVDTLGAIVRAIKPDGRLKMHLIGGFAWKSINGEYCTVHSARTDKEYTGTILLHQTSVHVYADARNAEEAEANMEVRLDYPTRSADDTKALGIEVGDFISFDPRVQITDEGFIKSRHLDDKVSVAILLECIKEIQAGHLKLAHTTHFYISNNEEIGYGGNSGISEKVVEYIAVDMGAMGDDQTTDEYTVSICVKDASGPYHLGLRNDLVDLCEANEIPYQLDIYPFYMSDASAAMRAGVDVKHGLIGAGIEASHAYERTHFTSVDATTDLVKAYLASPIK